MQLVSEVRKPYGQDKTSFKVIQYWKDEETGRTKTKVFTENNEPSKTDLSYAEDADINNIIYKYTKTGIIDNVAKVRGVFADVSDIPGLLEGAERIQEARDMFMLLPAQVRSEFKNDVVQFYNTLVDPNKVDYLVELGLLKKKKGAAQPEPAPTPPAEPTPTE